MNLTQEDFLRPGPALIPTEVIKNTFSTADVLRALGITRSAWSRHGVQRKNAGYPYVPPEHAPALFELAERKHVDLVAAINAWLEEQTFSAKTG